MIDPAVADVLTRLAELAARNTVGSVQTRINTAKAAKRHEETVNDLTEIINQLIEDRAEILGIATTLREQLVAQRVTAEEIAFITDTLIPTVERLAELSENEGTSEFVDALKSLVSVETLTVLQLVGFNFKSAIGEPLTAVVGAQILRLAPEHSVIPAPTSKQRPNRQRKGHSGD